MRIYNRGAAAPSIERERPHVMRHSMHTTRDVEVERRDFHEELDPIKMLNPTNLEAPPARPGYVQRWISDSVHGDSGGSVSKEWTRKMRQGWSPRDPSTVSPAELRIYETGKSQSGQGLIRMSGLVLCEMPRAAAEARAWAVQEKNKRLRASAHPGTEALRNGEARKAGAVSDVTITDDTRVVKGRRAATMLE
jgi:hypothetical protein